MYCKKKNDAMGRRQPLAVRQLLVFGSLAGVKDVSRQPERLRAKG
jgi:hypothetical protein